MRLGLLGLLICMNGLVLAVSSYERQLQYEGAPATITVTVRDEHGVPVEGALGEAFYWSTVSNTESEVSDYSDENGIIDYNRDVNAMLYRLFDINETSQQYIQEILALKK